MIDEFDLETRLRRLETQVEDHKKILIQLTDKVEIIRECVNLHIETLKDLVKVAFRGNTNGKQ